MTTEPGQTPDSEPEGPTGAMGDPNASLVPYTILAIISLSFAYPFVAMVDRRSDRLEDEPPCLDALEKHLQH